jgi:hypothetical protein
MQHIITLAPLIVEEPHLNWLLYSQILNMCKHQNFNQAVESANWAGQPVIVCCIKLITYMMDGIGIPVCSCLVPVLTFHSQIGVMLLAHCGFWAVEQAI